MSVSKKLMREIIRQEVNFVLFQVRIPTDIPWSKMPKTKRVCTECGKSFLPKRIASMQCSPPCYRKDYSRKYANWKKQGQWKIRARKKRKPILRIA